MKVGRKTVFSMVLLALAGLVLYLALRNPKPSRIPNDEAHAVIPSPDTCLSCHGPNEGVPQSPNHPISRQCMSCHAR